MTNKEHLKEILDEKLNEFIDINDFLFDNPELGNEEFISSKYLVDYLNKEGFTTIYPYCGVETAFRGDFIVSEDAPTVSFVAEYDALPGYGKERKPAHACGHNWIAATSIGAAIILSRIAKKLNININVMGTPAEETTGEKCTLIERGAFDDIDMAFQCHISELTSISRKSLAIDCYEFRFKGRATHAAAAPQNGINALDASNLMFSGINALRQHLTSDVRVHGIITDGGYAPNITPDSSKARFYIRAMDRKYLNEVTEKVINCAKGASLMTGAEVEYSKFENSFDNILYLESFQNVMRRNMETVGFDDIIDKEHEASGSTDVGNISQVCPTMFAEIKINTPEPAMVHEEIILKYLKTDYAYKELYKSILAMATTTAEIFENLEIFEEIKREFETK